MPKVTENTPPYCQFIRGSANKFGLGIDSLNAKKAGWHANSLWQQIQHEFNNGSESQICLSRQPRMLVLNRSQTMMTDNGRNIYAYDRENCKGYKAFSYWVVWFLDRNNQPLSRFPFRLKCAGYQGTSLMKLYDYPNETNTFSQNMSLLYQQLSGRTQIVDRERFLAHAVYQPNLVREMKAPRSNPQHGSMTVITKDYLVPTRNNFTSLLIINGSHLSQWIVKFMQDTTPWLRESALAQLETTAN